MKLWTVHTERGDYKGIYAWNAKGAMDRVWNMTCGRCGSVWSAERS